MPSWFTDAVLDAIAVLFPVECAGCGRPDRSLCSECRNALEPEVTPRSTPDGLTVHTALRYDGVARRVLLAMKESDRTDVAPALATPLAAAISRALATEPDPDVELVAVPTTRRSWRRRGYDPVALLCTRARIRLARILRHERGTVSQKSLGAVERASNLRGSMRARQPLSGRRFLLIDDVLTTGATLDEAARAIREAGGTVVCGAALAFTPRRFGGDDSDPTLG